MLDKHTTTCVYSYGHHQCVHVHSNVPSLSDSCYQLSTQLGEQMDVPICLFLLFVMLPSPLRNYCLFVHSFEHDSQ